MRGIVEPSHSACFGIGVGGIALAHFPLLAYQAGQGKLTGVESALFEPTGGSPGIVMLCTAWLVWIRRRRLLGFEGREAPFPGALMLMLGCALCLWGHYTSVQMLLIVSLSCLMLASGLLLGGFGAFRTLLFPSFFLLLALPVPTPLVNAVLYPLQLMNAKAAGFTLGILGFEPIVSGDLVIVGDTVFQVIESCSGLRTTLVVVMSAALYSQLTWHDRWRSSVLLALSPLVGIGTNHLRILTIIFNPYASLSSVHAAQGVAMVVFAVIVVALLDILLARVMPTAPEPHLPVFAPVGSVSRPVTRAYAVVGLSLAVGSFGLDPWRAPEMKGSSLAGIEANLPGWQRKGIKLDREFLGTVRFDDFIAHRYLHPDLPSVDLVVGVDRRLDPMIGIGSAKTGIPGPGGVALGIEHSRLEEVSSIRAQIVRMPTQRWLVYHWNVGLAPLFEEFVRSVLALDRSPFRRARPAAFVRLATPIDLGAGGREGAHRRIEAFVTDMRDDFLRAGVWPAPGS